MPLSMHFWDDPCHPRADWRTDRERLARYREWEWDTTVAVPSRVQPSPQVRVEVEYEDGGRVLHQTWRTPAGALEERLRVTDDWRPVKEGAAYAPIFDDFRPSRYLEPAIKDADDIPALEHIFPRESAEDADAIVRAHAEARTLAEEFQVPLSVDHAAGMDWLIWLFPPAEAVLRAVDNRPEMERILEIINSAHQRRLELLFELGVDMVERRGWYETTDFWSPDIFDDLARPALQAEMEAARRAGAAYVYLMDTGIAPLLPTLASLPFDCLLGVEPAYGGNDLKATRKSLPGKCLWTGISGPEHLGRGTPESVARAVEQAFAECGKTGFILGSAVGIRHQWPEENIAACERAWRKLR